MKKVMLRPGLTRVYGRLKTANGMRQTFIEPNTAYEVTDDYSGIQQTVRVPIGDTELRNELESAGIEFEMRTSTPPCCPSRGVDIYTFQPLVEVDTSIFEEV